MKRRTSLRLLLLAGVGALPAVLLGDGGAGAAPRRPATRPAAHGQRPTGHEPHQHGPVLRGGRGAQAARHGGRVVRTVEFTFETVPERDGIRIYLYDRRQRPMSWRSGREVQVTGLVRTTHVAGFVATASAKLRYQAAGGATSRPTGGHAPDSMFAKIDTAQVVTGGALVTVVLKGLAGETEREVMYGVRFVHRARSRPATRRSATRPTSGPAGS